MDLRVCEYDKLIVFINKKGDAALNLFSTRTTGENITFPQAVHDGENIPKCPYLHDDSEVILQNKNKCDTRYYVSLF